MLMRSRLSPTLANLIEVGKDGRSLSPNSFEHQGDVQRFLIEVAAKVLCTTCVMNDAEDFLERLYVDDAVQHRMVIVAVAGNSYRRVASRSVSRIADWQEAVKASYELRSERPVLTLVDLTSGHIRA